MSNQDENDDIFFDDDARQNNQDNGLRKIINQAINDEWRDVFDEIHTQGKQAAFDVSPLGYGLLHVASDQGNREILIRLIELGLDANLLDCHQESALHWAAASDRDQSNVIVGLLIEAGADVNKLNDKGASPLMISAMRGKNLCILSLIECGANFSEEDMQSRPISDETKLIIRSAFARRAASEALQKMNTSSLGTPPP